MPGSVTKNVFIALYQAQKDDSHREQCMFDNCYDIQIRIILESREKTGIGRNKTNLNMFFNLCRICSKKKNISKQLF